MDRSRHTVTKYLNDKKNAQCIKYENDQASQSHDWSFVRSWIGKVWNWAQTTNHCSTFCLTESVGTSLHFLQKVLWRWQVWRTWYGQRNSVLGTVGRNLEDVILSNKRDQSNAMRSGDCTDNHTANGTSNFFRRMCCNAHMKHDKSETGLFREHFGCTEMLCSCSKTYYCYDRKSNKYKFSSQGLNKRILDDCGDGPLSKYRQVLNESVNVSSTNRGFRTTQHGVAMNEQSNKELSYFFPKGSVEDDGIHTKP